MKHLKPIETLYKGYRFRSRLEARWAVFFDKAGIEWEYEPEGFELGGGERYLPDFFVYMNDMFDRYKGAGYWLEIKATDPTKEEIQKMEKLVSGGVHHGVIAVGNPGKNKLITVQKPRVISQAERDAWLVLESLSGFKKAKEIMDDPFESLFFSQIYSCCAKVVERDLLENAISAARSARFEFGESGAGK